MQTKELTLNERQKRLKERAIREAWDLNLSNKEASIVFYYLGKKFKELTEEVKT